VQFLACFPQNVLRFFYLPIAHFVSINNWDFFAQQTLQNSLRLVIYYLRNTERVPFGTTQKRRSLRKGLENITLRTISCTLERLFNDFMYSLFNGMYLSLTKLNFRCVLHTRTKFYIYVIPEYRVPWLDI
jgi:hypothetical protein